MVEKEVTEMAEKKHGREIAFVETYDEAVKGAIEKAFLRHSVSYLIKVDKVRDVKKGLFESKKKYSFHISRFQEDEAKTAMSDQNLVQYQDSIIYLIQV